LHVDSSPLPAMRGFVCVLIFSSFAHSELLLVPDNGFDIGDNGEKIVKIFERVSTLNVLLKNYEQELPEGIERWLENIFDFGLHTFIIFSFVHERKHREWMELCRNFADFGIRTQYHERFYRKWHATDSENSRLNAGFGDYTLFELEANEETMDPQAHVPPSPTKLHESFADDIDRWLTLRQSGFIVFCTFDEFELYLGCLVNRGGTFLFVITQSSPTTTIDDVTALLKRSWKASTNMRLFVLIFDDVYFHNPFAFDDNTRSFGAVEISDGEIQDEFRNLNAYSLNVEIFPSAYTIPKREFDGKLDSFVGPDINVAHFIEERLNVSSN
jgi:hypothetical protein